MRVLLVALALTACSADSIPEREDPHRMILRVAWQNVSAEDKASICKAVDLFGPEAPAQELFRLGDDKSPERFHAIVAHLEEECP